MKRILRGFILGMVIILLIAVPVFAYYYGNLSVVESEGNDYTNLPVIASLNASMLSDYGFISATGLDTRVLTGDGVPLPHMLANDKVLFVTDLAAHEDKSLIFYMGATSLSSFPIIVGYDGYITTPDDEDLELTYVMELLASGYFDASAGSDKNILYKEDAYRVYISGTSEITVAGLSAGDVEEWTMSYDGFTSGLHTVYVVSNGLGAYLYVDDFDVAKDTENFYDAFNANFDAGYDGCFMPYSHRTFYANGRYWAFYTIGGAIASEIYYRTSTDGASWTAASAIGIDADTAFKGFSVWFDGTYFHVGYGNRGAYGDSNGLRYRSGTPNGDGSISWRAAWQSVNVGNGSNDWVVIATDNSGYAYMRYTRQTGVSVTIDEITKSSTNDGTWTTAGGYPLVGVVEDRGALIGYPNSNKMYIVNRKASNLNLIGRYYNGAAWSGSEEVIDSSATTCALDQFNAIADMDDNVCIVWRGGTWATCGKINMRIRYADGSFGSIVEIESSGAESPTVSYDTERNLFYIFYVNSGSIYVRALSLEEGTISPAYFLCTPTALNYISATPYGSDIGVLYVGSATITGHVALTFPWVWDDNSNNWTWMQNNVMPYATDLLMAVDGTIHLEYEPADIIQGTTLPDISGSSDNDGIITWGTNVDGVATSMGPLTSSSYQPPPGVTTGNWTTPQDVMPTTGGESITGGLGTLDSNVFYPVISALSYISGLLPGKDPIPIPLMWVLIASIILVIAVGVCVWKMPHQLITALVGLGLIVLFNRMGIYPWWVYLIYVPLAVSILYYERKPSL